MEPRDGGATDPRSHAHRVVRRWPVIAVTLVMVLSVSAPMAIGGTGAATTAADASPENIADGTVQQSNVPSTNEQWTTPPGQIGQIQANDTVDEEKREAAEDGVDEAVETLQRQGVSVNQSQRAAAVNGTLAAVAQYGNASVEQIQNASRGAVAGTLLQAQNVSVEQVQNATFGAASGALSQHGNASATQLQHAAHGAAHGAVAQHQNATITQVQLVAQGAAAGAAHEAGKHDDEATDDESETVHPGAIREAAQGAAYGALAQEQTASVEQRQYAATGAAEGALNQSQSATVEQTQTASADANRTASVKEVQAAAMGAAKGSLTISQRQEVTVRQIQAAARGACKGALTQVQAVSITQVQEAAFGSAKGAISQSQWASVTQIQAAATGGAHGVVVQRQSVSITQIQYAATGAAKGAARSAAQNQVVDVEQIQAAAAGAGTGSIVQIQQVNIVMIQVISESAADGALSQHQEANVVQIQSAARGASEGSLSLSQRQEVTIEQTQIVTRDAAANTASTAAELNIDVDVTIVNYAKGVAEDPDDGAEDDDPDADELRSLFVSADGDSIFLANPNDASVTVTITSEDGDLQTVTLAPGESTDLSVDRGTYTLTAETADGETVELAGRAELTVSVGEAPESLIATVEDQSLVVENPNDERVTVDVAGDVDASFDVPGNWEESLALGPGSYVATAEAQDGASVPINDEDAFEFEIEEAEPPEPIDLTATVEDGNLSVENPSETDVTATVTGADGDEVRTFDVSAGESATESFEPGTYTLTAAAADDRNVSIDGGSAFEFTVGQTEPIDVTVTVSGENVSFDNPSTADVTVTAAGDAGGEQTIDVPGGENVTESLSPGNYTLTGESDEREVLLDGQSERSITVEEPAPVVESLNVTVDDDTVTIDNPNDVAVTVLANTTDAENRTIDVAADANVTETFAPGNYTLTAATADGTVVELNGEDAFEFSIGPETPEDIDLTASVDDGTLTVENPAETDVTATVTTEDAGDRTFSVAGGETVTEEFDPGNYTLTAEAEDDQAVLINGTESFEFGVADGEPINLTAAVIDRNLTAQNPSDTAATATVTADDGTTSTVNVPAGADVTESFEPGNYTVTAEVEDDRAVLINGNTTFEFNISALPPIDVNVTVEDGNVTFDNPSKTAVTVTATAEAGTERTIDLAPGANVTEAFEPGNYTLTGETTTDRSVLLNGESELAVEIDEPTDGGVGMQIDACGAITEPGQYELVSDLASSAAEGRESCLHVQASDVTIDGNGFAIEGPGGDAGGETTGIAVYNDTAPTGNAPAENVTVENVTVRGWETGVGTGPFFQYPTNVSIEDSVVAENARGLRFTELDGAVLDNVTVEANGQGVSATESDEIYVRSSTVQGNDGLGIAAGQATSLLSVRDTVVTRNGGDGIVVSNEGAPSSLSNVTVTDNAGVGIVHGLDTSDGTVSDAVVANNSVGLQMMDATEDITVTDTLVRDHDGDGIRVDNGLLSDAVTVENVTVTGSAGLDVNARNGTLTATDLAVGPATLSFADEPVALDGVPEGSLPALPDNATALGPGLDVSGIEVSLEATFAHSGEVSENENVELWRHDGAEWTSAGADVVEESPDSVTADLIAGGLYAPVAVEDEPEAVQPDAPTLSVDVEEVVDNETALLNVSYQNPNDAPLEPAESSFTDGTVTEQPPQVLAPGQDFALVEWTPESPAESVTWTANLSNVDLANATASGPTAAEVPGLLEPPEDTPTAESTPEPGAEDEPVPIPDQEETPEGPPTLGETPTPEPDAPADDTPTPTPEPAPEDTPSPAPEDGETQTPGNETA